MYGMNKRLCCLFDACCVVLHLFFSSLGQFCNKMEIANVCLIGIDLWQMGKESIAASCATCLLVFFQNATWHETSNAIFSSFNLVIINGYKLHTFNFSESTEYGSQTRREVVWRTRFIQRFLSQKVVVDFGWVTLREYVGVKAKLIFFRGSTLKTTLAGAHLTCTV